MPIRKSPSCNWLAPASTLTSENGAIGTIRIIATATTPLPTMRLCMRKARAPSSDCSRLWPSKRPIMNSKSELASTPAVALKAPIQGPSAAAVAAISTITGNTTSPPSTNDRDRQQRRQCRLRMSAK